jgi:hypothetical protein
VKLFIEHQAHLLVVDGVRVKFDRGEALEYVAHLR